MNQRIIKWTRLVVSSHTRFSFYFNYMHAFICLFIYDTRFFLSIPFKRDISFCNINYIDLWDHLLGRYPLATSFFLFVWYLILQHISCEIIYLVRNFHGQEWKLNKVVMDIFIECVSMKVTSSIYQNCSTITIYSPPVPLKIKHLEIDMEFYIVLFCELIKRM